MRLRRFATYAWLVLAFNVAVVLWGAYVRASGSGAGCGSHWPLCNGEVLPRAERVQTMVEFSHRASSGVAFVLVIILAVASMIAAPRGSGVRKSAWLALLFMTFEALIGAGLVLFRLVEHDESIARAASISLHLVNTFFLLAALVRTAWCATVEDARVVVRGQGPVGWLIVASLAAMFVVGTSGAVAALGDTLFPARSLAEGFAQDLSPTAHLFLRLRALHPILSAATGALVLTAAGATRAATDDRRTRVASFVVTAIVIAQIGAGLANLALLAPVWMQLVHLLFADSLWIALVALASSALTVPAGAAKTRVADGVARAPIAP